jgi:hypothetical protein
VATDYIHTGFPDCPCSKCTGAPMSMALSRMYPLPRFEDDALFKMTEELRRAFEHDIKFAFDFNRSAFKSPAASIDGGDTLKAAERQFVEAAAGAERQFASGEVQPKEKKPKLEFDTAPPLDTDAQRKKMFDHIFELLARVEAGEGSVEYRIDFDGPSSETIHLTIRGLKP